MAKCALGRCSAICGGVLATATLVGIAIGSGSAADVSAQIQPTITVSTSIPPLPPLAPGLGEAADGSGDTPLADAALIAGTPAAPAAGDTVTASLGGSDISVSSVGGSYEVDGPRKRGNRPPRR